MSCGWHACSRDTYMSADTYSAQQYEMAVGSHTCSGNTYMSANTYPVQEYEMLVGSHAFSVVTYMPVYCATIALGGYSPHSGNFHYIQDVDLGLYMQHYLRRTLAINTPGLVTPSIHFTSGRFCFRLS